MTCRVTYRNIRFIKHSATYHAGRGVDALNLMSFHGWEMLATAQVYLSESTANTQRALRAAHSR